MIYPDWIQIDSSSTESLYVESINIQLTQDFFEIGIISPVLSLEIQQPELALNFLSQSIELEVI